jgi:hypothetical protein
MITRTVFGRSELTGSDDGVAGYRWVTLKKEYGKPTGHENDHVTRGCKFNGRAPVCCNENTVYGSKNRAQ